MRTVLSALHCKWSGVWRQKTFNMLIYGIDSDDGLMTHIAREIKQCKYFHVISNENGIYSLCTDRNSCKLGKHENLVCKWENNELTWSITQ